MTRKFLTARHGNAAVEFAIVAPVFLMLMAAVIAFGLYFTAAHATQQLAANAARAAVAGLSANERRDIATAHVALESGRFAMVRPDAVVVEAGDVSGEPGRFLVRVALDASYLPIWAFDGLLPLPPRTIERSAVIQRGGY